MGSIKHYLTEIGRGAVGSRSLDVVKAEDLMAQVLDGQVTEVVFDAAHCCCRVRLQCAVSVRKTDSRG